MPILIFNKYLLIEKNKTRLFQVEVRKRGEQDILAPFFHLTHDYSQMSELLLFKIIEHVI